MISLWVRLYDPASGRFTQPNSLGYAGGGTLYAYAGNNLATYYANLRFMSRNEGETMFEIIVEYISEIPDWGTHVTGRLVSGSMPQVGTSVIISSQNKL